MDTQVDLKFGFQRTTLKLDSAAGKTLRFTAHCPGVASSIVGTRNLAHFQQNLAWVAKGPLPAELVTTLRTAFRGRNWPGLI